jgi:hypothetical protein
MQLIHPGLPCQTLVRWFVCALGALSLSVPSALAEPPSPAAQGLFVAVGYGGRRIASHDGIHWENDQRWSDVAADNDDVLFNVAFGRGRFIAVGGATHTGHLLSTRDGREWKELPSVRARVATIVFGNGRFIAGHDAELLASSDGENFEPGEKLLWKGSTHARRAAFGDGEAGARCVIIGDIDLWAEKKRVSWRASTEDGRTYTSKALDTPAARDIAYGGGLFVVVGPEGLIESSHDGEAWQRYETVAGENFSRIIWTGERFLVSGGRTVWSSPDGLEWKNEARPSPCGFAWAREGWLGLGFSWGGNLYMSKDLASWKKLEIPPGPSFEAVAYGVPVPSGTK